MCECLDYDDGTRHVCEACVPLIEETERRLRRANERLAEATAIIARRCPSHDWPLGGVLHVGKDSVGDKLVSCHLTAEERAFLDAQGGEVPRG